MNEGNGSALTQNPERPAPPPGAGDGGSGDLGERIARLEALFEAEMKHLATKADIANVKLWLFGVIGAAVVQIVAVTVLVLRVFMLG